MRSQDELRAALGLLLLAGAAWSLPALRGSASSGRPPTPKVLYSLPGDRRLFWSPADALRSPGDPGLQGSRSEARSALGGWRGLLLGNRLDLNGAASDDLTALPGIGPGKATAILETRDILGRFRTVEDLLEVPGIGEKTLEKLRPLVRVEGPAKRRGIAAENILPQEQGELAGGRRPR